MITNHVTNLELSKKLAELGIPQKSEFYWWVDKLVGKIPDKYTRPPEIIDGIPNKLKPETDYYSAFLSSELGEMLPSMIKKHQLHIMTVKDAIDKDGLYRTFYKDYSDEDDYFLEHSNTMANSMAKMLIYLITNGIIKI